MLFRSGTVWIFSGAVWKKSNSLFMKHKPTAVLSTRYDLGSCHDNGFWVGSSTITTTTGTTFQNPPGPNGPPRQIFSILRGKNYLRKEENEGTRAAVAAILMDDHAGTKKLLNELEDPGRLQVLLQHVFAFVSA